MSESKQQVNKWEIYEQEKKKLQDKNLTPNEYDSAIQEILRRLKI